MQHLGLHHSWSLGAQVIYTVEDVERGGVRRSRRHHMPQVIDENVNSDESAGSTDTSTAKKFQLSENRTKTNPKMICCDNAQNEGN